MSIKTRLDAIEKAAIARDTRTGIVQAIFRGRTNHEPPRSTEAELRAVASDPTEHWLSRRIAEARLRVRLFRTEHNS
jgi:hypothetical protein